MVKGGYVLCPLVIFLPSIELDAVSIINKHTELCQSHFLSWFDSPLCQDLVLSVEGQNTPKPNNIISTPTTITFLGLDRPQKTLNLEKSPVIPAQSKRILKIWPTLAISVFVIVFASRLIGIANAAMFLLLLLLAGLRVITYYRCFPDF